MLQLPSSLPRLLLPFSELAQHVECEIQALLLCVHPPFAGERQLVRPTMPGPGTSASLLLVPQHVLSLRGCACALQQR